MSTLVAPASAERPRMSLWTAFWGLFGGAIVGLLAATLVFDPVQFWLGLDAAAPGPVSVWQPFPPVGYPAHVADLVTFAAAVLFCALAARRISHTPESELSLPAAAAAVAAVVLIAQETRSWWCLTAVVPAAVALRYAARPPRPRATWRRRATVATAAIAVYAAVTGLAFADLQRHPLATSGDGTCGVQRARSGRVTDVCLEVVNMARSRTARVLGVAPATGPSPFRLAVGEQSIRPQGERDLEVAYRTSCAGVPAGTYTLREIPLRVRAGGDESTAAIATPVAFRKTCG